MAKINLKSQSFLINYFLLFIQSRKLKYILVGIVFLTISFLFLSYRNVQYNYSGQSCIFAPTILPNMNKQFGSSNYVVENKDLINLFGKPIFSKTSCLKMIQLAKENSKTNFKYGIFNFLSRKYFVYTPEYPKAHASFNINKVVVDQPLKWVLSKPDNTFSYSLNVDSKKANCDSQDKVLECDVKALNLSQSTNYKYVLIRSFLKEHGQTVNSASIKTITPLVLESSSIGNNTTVFDKPDTVDISFNKTLKSNPVYKLYKIEADKMIEQESSLSVKQNKMTVHFTKPLNRASNYQLKLVNAKGEDGSILPDMSVINFYVSDGPKTVGSNLRDRSMNGSQNFVLGFDQDVKTGQDLTKLISLEIDGSKKPISISVSNRNVIIDPTENINKCTKFTIKVTPGILNIYEVAASSNFSFTARTTCFDQFSIGNSLDGRAIMAYSFGSGSLIMFVASIHGDEFNTASLMYKWIDEIEGNPARVPQNKRIVIIPTINPDGLAKKSRLNSRGVDLNRNFASNDWKPDVKMPWGTLLTNGGGVSAISEPETSAVANFISSNRPTLVVTYHSWASISEANEASDSVNKAMIYSSKSNYRFSTINSSTSFNYDTTGSMEAWMGDRLGIANVLVELASRSYDEFGRNKEAMWSVL